jgi:hypothetical protein
VCDAQLLGDGAAVTAVPVEQLQNAGRVAQFTRAHQRTLVGDRIDHPDAPVRGEDVRGPLHEAWLGCDPAEPEADLIDEADASHATDGTWASQMGATPGARRGEARRSQQPEVAQKRQACENLLSEERRACSI